jgi:hypothetical protein
MVQKNKKRGKRKKKSTKFIGSKKIGFAGIDVDYSADVCGEKVKLLKQILEQILN